MSKNATNTASLEGMEGCWGADTEEYLSVQNQKGISDWSIPEEHPLLWSMEDQCRVQACAMLFSSEYMFDFDARKAMMRLGVDPDEAKVLAKQYMNNHLVLKYLRYRMQNFRKQNSMTQDTVLAWVYQEATDRSVFANPLARVKAQTLLMKYLDLEGPNAGNTKVNLHGGVMLVSAMETPESWEAKASDAQRKLQEST